MLDKTLIVQKVIFLFKHIEPLFWFAEIMIVLNLIYPDFFFNMQLQWLNKLLKFQGFDVDIKRTQKAYDRWYKDLWILLFLIVAVIVLIRFI